MKRLLVLVLAALLAGLTACSGPSEPPPEDAGTEEEPVEITFWTYAVGEWGNRTAISNLISGFRRSHPNIQLTVEYLDYDTGDARVAEAIAAGCAPDVVLESPERIEADWGVQGLMLDLSDLWETEKAEGIYDAVRTACRSTDGAYYVVPLCMGAHCMALNYDLFEAAGALQYLDEENHTWTTEGFLQAVEALRAYGQDQVAAIYCGGQGGDQGTRALVTNLYGGTFTDEAHTHYTVYSEENIRALELLRNTPGIVFDPDLVGSGEIDLFCRKELAMAFCWNAALEVTHTIKNPDLDFKILPMAFPTDSGKPRLQFGIWGFGVFDNGDERRAEAAKEFIRYITEDDSRYTRAVEIANYWPVRDIEGIYANDALMATHSRFIPYVGTYCQVAPNWVSARTGWWQMLQKIGEGGDVPALLQAYCDGINEGLMG